MWLSIVMYHECPGKSQWVKIRSCVALSRRVSKREYGCMRAGAVRGGWLRFRLHFRILREVLAGRNGRGEVHRLLASVLLLMHLQETRPLEAAFGMQ